MNLVDGSLQLGGPFPETFGDLLATFRVLGVQIHFSTLVPPLEMYEYEHDRDGVPRAVAFHSSAFFHMFLAGALWHEWPENCPTWSDATECRCNVEGAR